VFKPRSSPTSQPHSQRVDPSLVLKWSFSDFQDYLARDHHRAGPNFVRDELAPKLKRILAFVTQAAKETLTQGQENGLCFGLYGADIILDVKLQPWLTEIQRGPGLSFDDDVKMKLVPRVLEETARIVLEIQERKRAGRSLADLASPREFEWVINEAS